MQEVLVFQKLLDPCCYGQHISAYLSSERAMVKELLRTYDTIVEVGCFNGTYVDLAMYNMKNYIGIDKNVYPRTIPLNKRSHAVVEFHCVDMNDEIGFIKTLDASRLPKDRMLFVFPFNVMGYMHSPAHIIKLLIKWRAGMFISLFKNNDFALQTRLAYFTNAGLKDLEVQQYAAHAAISHTTSGVTSWAVDLSILSRDVGLAWNELSVVDHGELAVFICT
jgi:hypothetical protein